MVASPFAQGGDRVRPEPPRRRDDRAYRRTDLVIAVEPEAALGTERVRGVLSVRIDRKKKFADLVSAPPMDGYSRSRDLARPSMRGVRAAFTHGLRERRREQKVLVKTGITLSFPVLECRASFAFTKVARQIARQIARQVARQIGRRAGSW